MTEFDVDLVAFVRGRQETLRREWLAACTVSSGPADSKEADAVFGAMLDALEPHGGWWLDATAQSLAESGAQPEDLAREIGLLRRVIAEHLVKEFGIDVAKVADARLGDAVGGLVTAFAGRTEARPGLDDEATGLPNRRALEADLGRWLPDTHHNRLVTLTFATLCDPDSGDAEATRFADAARRCLRSGDVAYRLGRRDFAVALANTGRHGARAMLNRVADLGAPPFVWSAATSFEGPYDWQGLLNATEAQHREARPE